jgi:hypothetical protein
MAAYYIAEALFIRLIIRLFQFIFSAGTVFSSHNKSANSVFQPAYQHSRTAPKFALISNSECMWLHNVLSFLSQCIEHDSHVENGSNIKFGLV